MTTEEIVHRYQHGQTTVTGLVLDVLRVTDKNALIEILEKLPPDMAKELKGAVDAFGPRTLILHGPRPTTATIQFVKNWFAKAGGLGKRKRNAAAPTWGVLAEKHYVRTRPIGESTAFRELQAHADKALASKGYKLLEKKGSVSWLDPRIDPVDHAVRFKLCNCMQDIFFGVREEWAKVLGVSVAQIGGEAHSFSPSPVVIRGDFVGNTDEGRRRIDRIIALLPAAGETTHAV